MPSRRRNRQLSGQRDRFRAILQFEIFRRHESGEINSYEIEKALAASDSDRVITKIMRRYERDSKNGVLAADWNSIVAWFQEHWGDILQAILALVMVFMDPDEARRV